MSQPGPSAQGDSERRPACPEGSATRSSRALARRYRRLLAWFPAEHRKTYGEEMLGVLLAAAPLGRNHPSLAETRNLVSSGLRARLRTAGSLTLARAVICLIAAMAVTAVLLTGVGGSIRTRDPAASLLLAAWWLSPLGYYRYRVTTATGAWVLGAAYLAASGYLLIAVYRQRGYIAAPLDAVFLPAFLWAGMLVGVDADRALERWTSLRPRSSTPAGRHDGEGIRAVYRRRAPAWWQWMVPTGLVLACIGDLWWNAYILVAAVIWSAAGAWVANLTKRRQRKTHAASS